MNKPPRSDRYALCGFNKAVRSYRGEDNVGEYEDETGFCKATTTEEIADNDYIVTPGRYVGIEQGKKSEVPYDVKIEELTAELREEFKKSEEMQSKIEENLRRAGF